LLLAQGDQGLDHAAQFLGLRHGRLDRFVFDQGVGQILQQSLAMGAGAIEFTESVSVAHGAFPFSDLNPQPYKVLRGAQ